ncbi:MAG TPA: hypothetical protein VMW24_17765, partial [Sedimentisphaerales bacterium]|nr:hypothetical protein [Sedimentisphaerales bacterium]
TANFKIPGALTLGSNTNWVADQDTLTLDGTGAQVLTMNGDTGGVLIGNNNGGSIALGSAAGFLAMDLDDGAFYQKGYATNCLGDFSWSTDDSLAIDAALRVGGSFTVEGSGKWYTHANLDQYGTGTFLWDISSGTSGWYGHITQGYAGQTIEWLVPGATNRYPTFRDGGRFIIADPTGDVAGYIRFYAAPVDGDTVWVFNGATSSADSGDINVHMTNAGHTYLGDFDAPNVELIMRPYTSADTNFVHLLGDVTALRWWANTQYSNEAWWYLESHDITIGSGGMGFGNNGTPGLTVVDRTAGTITTTDAGNFSISDDVDISAGAGYYDIDGNLSIGSGTNDLETASWAMTGTGAQTITVSDMVPSLTIANTGGSGSVTPQQAMHIGDLDINDGTYDFNSKAHTVSGDFTWDSDNTLTLNAVLAMIGNSKTFHLGNSGSPTIASGITWNGTNGIWDNDFGPTSANFKTITLGANASLTMAGDATAQSFGNSAAMVILGNNSTLTNNILYNYYNLSGTGSPFSFGTGYTFNGTGGHLPRAGADNITVSLPAMTYTGSGDWTCYEQGAGISGWTFKLAGNIDLGTSSNFLCKAQLANNKGYFDGDTYGITCKDFAVGGTWATDTMNATYGSGTYNVVNYAGATSNTGVISEDFETSVWNFSGDWLHGTAKDVDLSTSPITANGIGAQAINCQGDAMDSLCINKAGGTLSTSADLQVGGIHFLSGGFSVAGDVFSVARSFWSTAAADWTSTAGQMRMLGDDVHYAMSPNDTGPNLGLYGTPVYIDTGNGATAGLYFGVDGVKALFQPNKRYTFTDTMAVGGIAGSLDTIASQTATLRDTIMLESITTFDYTWMRDNVWLGDKATFGTGSKSGGGNF